MKLPILKAFVASFAYVAMRFWDVLRANWLGVLLLHGGMIILIPRYLAPIIEMQTIDPNADSTAVLSAMGPALQSLTLLYVLMAIIYPMLIAGNLRPLLRGESHRFRSILILGWMSCAFLSRSCCGSFSRLSSVWWAASQ